VRFILDDQALTRQLKDFRLVFQDILRSFSAQSRLEARNTEQDVGIELEGRGEYQRHSIHDVLAANFGRLQESLRSLEEFSKLAEPAAARRFERLRYRCYTFHKTIVLISPPLIPSLQSVHPNISDVRFYALIDVRADEEEFTAFVKAMIDGGVEAIQLRDKTADDRTLLARSRILKEQIALSGRPVLFVMNDRPDLARLAEADAVHVGQEELPVEAVRRIVGSKMLIGVSTHCIEQARQAVGDGADYIGAGPVFESATKDFTEFPGPDYLRQVVEEIRIPAFAVGGITIENIDEVLATGIRRAAVGSALLRVPDSQAVAKFAERMIR
jgi:thiamine-phosphate pyrophosphorylase